jgi:hypothetical protein
MSISNIQTLYEEAIETEKNIHKDLSEDEQKTRALQGLSTEFKKQLRSPAVGFEGMVFAASDKRDLVANLKKSAMAVYIDNPHEAIEKGLTNDEGIPLDPRPTWSTGRENPGFGKPFPEHSWIRTVYGIALKSSEQGEPKFFTMTLNGDVAANDNISMYTPVKFRAIDKSSEGDAQYALNASMYTKFENADLSLPKPMDLISKFCNNMTLDMNKLDEYHATNKTNYNRMVIIKGNVSTLHLEPNSIGNKKMIIESENSFEDLDAIGTTCWIPAHINLDFAEKSKVIVIGSTSQGFKYENGQKTEELGDVMINTYGVYAIPEYKVSVEVEELTEDNVIIPEKTEDELTTEEVIADTIAPEPIVKGETKPTSSW